MSRRRHGNLEHRPVLVFNSVSSVTSVFDLQRILYEARNEVLEFVGIPHPCEKHAGDSE